GIADKLHIGHLLGKRPAQLSGGERQRVAIGRALMREATAYLMDDPISALDARLREEMRVELKRLQREIGHTFIYVTQIRRRPCRLPTAWLFSSTASFAR